MKKEIIAAMLIVVSVLGCISCSKKPAAQNSQTSEWAKKVELYKDETPEELYEKAKKEGNVVVYYI